MYPPPLPRGRFAGIGWLVVLTIPLEAASFRGPAHESRLNTAVREPATEEANPGRGQELSADAHGNLAGSLLEVPGTNSDTQTDGLGSAEDDAAGSRSRGHGHVEELRADVHGVLKEFRLENPGTDPGAPAADPGLAVGQSAGDTPLEAEPRQKEAAHALDSAGAEQEDMPRKRQKVGFEPGNEVVWDDQISPSFVSHLEKLGFPLGPEPHRLKLTTGSELGRGEYVKVYDAILVSPIDVEPPRVAVKCVNYGYTGDSRGADAQMLFMMEFRTMATEMAVSLEPFGCQMENILITELADSSLKQWLIEIVDLLLPGDHTDLRKIHKFMISVLYGLATMHHHGIAHRDVTLDSLLLTCPAKGQSCKLVFAGFGYACVFKKVGSLINQEEMAKRFPCNFLHGAYDYMPPELPHGVLLDADMMNITTGQDVWAAGVVLLLLLDPVWAGSSIFRTGQFGHLSPAVRERLHKDPGSVIDDLVVGRADLATSPLGQGMVAVLRKMLCLEEDQRASADECYRELLRIHPDSERDVPEDAAGAT